MIMDKETTSNIKLGLFVSVGLVFLIVSVYFIGSKKNLFSSTFKVYAVFNDVNGLQTGNNIRFLGIDIGTVKKITVISDSTINVLIVIEKQYQSFLKKNSVAGIATDGLMGNKIINIHNENLVSGMLEEYDTLTTSRPIETEEVLRTLSASSYNVKEITDDLKKITEKINKSNSLWNLLADSLAAENLKQAIVNIKLTGNRSAIITGDLGEIVRDIKSGKGSIGALLTDTLLSSELKQTIVDIRIISDTMAMISGDLKSITEKIRSGEGAMGTILMDTSFVRKLNESLENIREGSEGFNQNMEALKHSFPLKKYFKKKSSGL